MKLQRTIKQSANDMNKQKYISIYFVNLRCIRRQKKFDRSDFNSTENEP